MVDLEKEMAFVFRKIKLRVRLGGAREFFDLVHRFLGDQHFQLAIHLSQNQIARPTRRRPRVFRPRPSLSWGPALSARHSCPRVCGPFRLRRVDGRRSPPWPVCPAAKSAIRRSAYSATLPWKWQTSSWRSGFAEWLPESLPACAASPATLENFLLPCPPACTSCGHW